MKAGRLRHWLRLERPIGVTRDAFGGAVKEWAPVIEVDAAVDSISGREYLAADRELAGVTWRITIRETPGVTVEPDWRAVDLDDDAARTFDFVEILPSHNRADITIAATCGLSNP
jgi:head-tail adaptor